MQSKDDGIFNIDKQQHNSGNSILACRFYLLCHSRF